MAMTNSSSTEEGSASFEGNRNDHGQTAILLLDFQNEFCKKGGKLHNDVAETMLKTGILENTPKLINLAR